MPAEIYHLKAAGEANWPKMDQVHRRRSRRRAREGLKITADMYTYTGRRDRARRRDAAVGARRRLRGAVQAAARSGAARAEIAAAMQDARAATGRTCISPPGRPTRAAGRVQDRDAEAADRQDAGRGREDARHGSGRHDHGPRARGRVARRRGLLPDVGGQHPRSSSRCRGCRSAPTRRRWRPKASFLEVVDAPARLRQLRARCSASTCARTRCSRSRRRSAA